MSRLTKQYQIDSLTAELSEANITIRRLTNRIDELNEQASDYRERIDALTNEIDQLIHTPQFAADTEAAFNRGRNEGVRSLASTANNYMYAMAEETVIHMNKIVNKYTRELTYQLFQGIVLEEDVVSELPDTDFAKNLIAGLEKIDVVGSSHTETE